MEIEKDKTRIETWRVKGDVLDDVFDFRITDENLLRDVTINGERQVSALELAEILAIINKAGYKIPKYKED